MRTRPGDRRCRSGSLVLAVLILLGMLSRYAVAAEPGRTLPSSVVPMNSSAKEGQLLLNAVFPGDQWTFFSGRKDASLNETWKIAEDTETKSPILICLGEPHGYLRTRAEYASFDLSLEWRFPRDPDGNSGILLFTSGEDRLWPSALQIQLHQPELGIVFPIGGAKSANELRPTEKLAKPVNQWNQCEIQCRNGTVSVTINGQILGEVNGCLPAVGTIALQSEGSEIHFRSIRLHEIPVAQAEVPQPVRDSQPDGGKHRQ